MADRLPAQLFVQMWGLAACFRSQLPYLLQHTDTTFFNLAAYAAGLLAVARPRSETLALLALVQIGDVVMRAPEVTNHWLLMALVNVTFLVVALGQRRLPELGEWVDACRRPLVVGTAIFYLFTGFWKLNTGFLDPASSCASEALARYDAMVGGGLPVEALRGPAIWGTLGMELLLPWFLLARRSAPFAAAALAAFHLVLGFDLDQVFLNFSSVMFALLLLAAPTEPLKRFGTLWMGWAVGVYLVGLAGLAVVSDNLWHVARWMVWVPYGLVVTAGFVRMALEGSSSDWGRSSPLAWSFLMLVVVNGVLPIVGVKNRTSWQMYSNVRLEADASNHLLVPRSLDGFGMLADRVEVVSASEDALVLDDGLAWTWFMFREEAAKHPAASVTYRRGGVMHEVPSIGDDPELRSAVGARVFFFRPLGTEVGQRCQW